MSEKYVNSIQEYLDQDWQLGRRTSEPSQVVVPFDNYERIEKHYAQAGQDLFALSCLNGKTNGIYLELGCETPTIINNTYLLEDKFSWKGVSVDINPIQHPKDPLSWEQRNSILLKEDCRLLDFDKIINLVDSNHFDYLSLDLEPALTTLECLSNIPFDKVSFSVITYEHDAYSRGDFCKQESRKIMNKHGYKSICTDVIWHGNVFEDWYFNPKDVSYDRIQGLQSDNKEWTEILFKEEFYREFTGEYK